MTTKNKSIILEMYRFQNSDMYVLGNEEFDLDLDFCGRAFRQICPALTKRLRKGCGRKVKLIQTKNGIRLERITRSG